MLRTKKDFPDYMSDYEMQMVQLYKLFSERKYNDVMNMVGNVIMTMQRKTGYVGIGSVYPEFQLEVYPDTDAVANIGKLRVGHIGVTGSGGISHFDNA